MLNMLIAIMGDTFARVIENRQLNTAQTKIEIMGEQTDNIIEFNCCGKKNSDENDQEKAFLFVVTPEDADGDDMDSWEGSIKQMSKLNQQFIEIKCDGIVKQISGLH